MLGHVTHVTHILGCYYAGESLSCLCFELSRKKIKQQLKFPDSISHNIPVTFKS